MKQIKNTIEDDIEAIINGCQKNNRASQKILYDRYFERLYVHSQSYRMDDQDKMSLINKTMLQVFQNINSYRGNGAFESWIHTIHKNNILNHFRTSKQQNLLDSNELNMASFSASVNGDEWDESDMEYLHLAIQSLPDMTREVLELYAIQGYKHNEIAQKLKMSESNSKYHLGKARELIAKKMKRNHG